MAPPPIEVPDPLGRCRTCSASLAIDQRYCLECGTCRGEISPALRELIVAAAAGTAAAAPAPAESADEPEFALPPRAMAVAVAALLAFGVLVGSIVSPPAESAGNAPVVVAMSPPPAAAPAPTPAAPAPAAAEEPHAETAPAAAAPPPTRTIYVQAPQQDQAPQPAQTAPKPLPVPPLPKLPPIQHVFVVMLSNHGYDAAFGPDSPAGYLSKTLPEQGELVPNYYAVTHGELANEIALVSGQGPNPDTAANCPTYSDVTPGTPDSGGQAAGQGCVYPAATKTLADQLFGLGLTWKAYVEDVGAGGADAPQTCRHPDPGAADPYQEPRPGDAYVDWRNPFVYFHSLLDPPPATCNASDFDLKQLPTDLQQVGDTPALSFIVPNRCHDGSDQPCAPDQPAGLAAADSFLQSLIPSIMSSPAYKQGGLIAITFDQAPQDGPEADSSSCCGTPQYPNLPADSSGPAAAPTGTTPAPAPDATVKPTGGGGRVGMLLLSPYIIPKSVNTTGFYNHFSLLRSIEDLFGLDPLGYAATPSLPVFDDTVYTGYNTDS